MRRATLLLFCSIFLSFLASAQVLTRMQSWGLDFESIVWVNDQRGFIVGEKLIVYTEDGGNTWKEVLQSFDFKFYDLAFIDENSGIAVGEEGQIYITNDQGETWNPSISGTQKSILGIEILQNGKIVAVGESGLILTSANSGSSWVNQSMTIHQTFLDIEFFDNNEGYIVGEQGKVYKTSNGGLSWTDLSAEINENLTGITITPTHRIFVVGNSSTILNSNTKGATWTKLTSPVSANYSKIQHNPLDERILVLTGENNTLVRSTNSGATFTRINLPISNNRKISNLAFKPGSPFLNIVGQDGYGMSSTNGGSTWTLRLLGNRVDFLALDFVTSQFGLMGGTNGKFFVTANSMQTLIPRPIPFEVDILALEFWNSNYGFVTGKGGMMLRTSNSGQLWTNLDAGTTNDFRGIHLFLPEFPYAVGQNGLIARSSGSSGNSWEVFNPAVTGTESNINDLNAFDLVNAFAVGDQGYISTSNNGFQWNKISSGTTEDLLYSARINDTIAIAVGKNGTILKSTDLAKTWKNIPSGFSEDFRGVHFFGPNYGFIVGEKGLFLISADGGETWKKFNSGTLRDLNAVFSVNENTAYAVGNDGTILSYTCTPPTGNLGAITGKSETCLGTETYSLTSDIVQGSELVWRVDGGEIISGQGTTSVEVKWTIPGRNGVYVSRLNFCGAGETSALEVKVSAIPSSNLIIDGQGAVCQSKSYIYQLPSQVGMTYTWAATGGEILEGQNTNKVSIKWTSTGAQAVSVVLENLCGKSESIKLPIQIEQAPAQSSSITGASLSGLGEQNYEVVAVPNLDYRWTVTDGGKIIAGQGTSKIAVLWEKEGDFEVSVQAQNACDFGPKSSLAVKVYIITAIEPNSPDTKLKIFPNPSFGTLTIDSPSLDSWRTIQIFNSLGQKITERIINPNEQSLYFENLPRGLNIIVLSGPKGESQRKILIL